MANRIKGITVEIGGDTTKLSKALESVNKNIKSTQTQLKDVEKLLKLDPSNTELLSQKQKLLADAVSSTKEKLETLKTAAEQANTALANGEFHRNNMMLSSVKSLKRNRSYGIYKQKRIKPTQHLRKLVQLAKSCRMLVIRSPVQVKNCFLLLAELPHWEPLLLKQEQTLMLP